MLSQAAVPVVDEPQPAAVVAPAATNQAASSVEDADMEAEEPPVRFYPQILALMGFLFSAAA